jgi:acetyltransferase, GNAT family
METKEMNIQLIANNINDFKGLLDVFEEVFQWIDYRYPTDEKLDYLLKNTNLLAVVAKIENQVVGGLTAYILHSYEVEKPTLYLHDLGVKACFQNQGIGKQLINYLIAYAKQNDFQDIFVGTEQEDNEDAIAFYRKTPFTDETKVLQYSFQL